MTPYRSSLPDGGDGFTRLLRAEWAKLASVPSWGLTMAAAVALTIVVAVLTAAGTDAVSGGGRDDGSFAHRPLTGDGSAVARVTAQTDSHEWAKAGLMIRDGSAFAAVMVTPDHGVRMQSGSTPGARGRAGTVPRWLKLTRSGTSVTGYESFDGATWSRVGTVELDGLPRTVAAGPFVASPTVTNVGRQFGGETIDQHQAAAKATFARVSLTAAAPWRGGRAFTMTGSGDIGPDEYREDVVERTLAGVLLGLVAIVAVAALFITSEYGRGTIRTTFAASPRRPRVLAAKAIVIGAATFAAGLAASFGAYLLSRPLLHSEPPLSDGPVLRAVVGTAALLAVVAVLSLGVAAILRHGGAAIGAVLLLLLVPQIVATGLPVSIATWVERLTPAAGFAIQQTVHRYDTAIGPWAGLGVLSAYAAAAMLMGALVIVVRDPR